MSNNKNAEPKASNLLVNTTVKILAIFTMILTCMSMYSSITFWGVPCQGEVEEVSFWLGYSLLMLMVTVLMSMFSMYLWVEATYVVPTVVDTTVPVGVVTTEWNSTHDGVTTTCTACQCEFTTPYSVAGGDLCDGCWLACVEASDARLAALEAMYQEQDRIDAILEAGSSCYWCNAYLPDELSDCPRCDV